MCFNCLVSDISYSELLCILFEKRNQRKVISEEKPEQYSQSIEKPSEEQVRPRVGFPQAHLAGRTCHSMVRLCSLQAEG
jgi:hypothetical protein